MAANDKIHAACTHPDRIINEIFSDQNYVKEKVRAEQFVSKLFEINCNMQDISDLDFDFSDFFTPEELFENWQMVVNNWERTTVEATFFRSYFNLLITSTIARELW